MSEKLLPDEIDGDFRSLTLSLSTPLPPLHKAENAILLDQWIAYPVSDVADWGDRRVEYENGPLFPVKPRWSGQLFPKKPLLEQRRKS